ncbi:MAG TPA: 5-carboxymethyl-2-hydroxymuconate semialdehyde dehydrogenase [Anaerolineales bacterium]|nr:5-carboxymethyl-2-hydroxymuconate semialdehyde dehydrogenase [Anaerolineales bacterium]
MIKHFIDNQFVPSIAGETFSTLNPADNQVITAVAAGSAGDADLAVRAARRAFDSGPWPRLGAAERAKALRKIGDLIEKYADEIADIEIRDTGVPISQIKSGAIPRAAQNFFFFAEMATKIAGESYPKDNQFLNYTVRRPAGVAGLITPWNVPFMLETWKVAPCLAAGNTCILKPAEWAPLSADKLAHIIQEADLPPGVFNVLHGFGQPAGSSLVSHPGVQLISFTGETVTGQEIIRNGAATLKRFSMELGGKSPTIIFEDANLERALDGAIWQVYSLNGERCTAGSRLLVQDSIYDRLIDQLQARVRNIQVGDPTLPATEVGPLIHPEHWDKVRSYMDVARGEGATILVGGERPAHLPMGNYFQPTLITNVNNEMRIAQEEIFGPVLVVIRFKDEAEALRIANHVRYGLAAYVWTSDIGRGHRLAEGLESGLVWINSHNVRDLRTPFGGAKDSGIGREGGHYSFDFYTELTTIHVALGEHRIPKMGKGGDL